MKFSAFLKEKLSQESKVNIILILVMKIFHPGRLIFNHFTATALLLPTA